MIHVAFHVSGDPAPKGSARAFVNPNTGRAIITNASKKTKPWESVIAGTAREKMVGLERFTEAVVFGVCFYLKRPKAHRDARYALKRSAPTSHISRPDLDKLVRTVADALTVAGVWTDDSVVAEIVARKRYSDFDTGATVLVAPIARASEARDWLYRDEERRTAPRGGTP